jgi:hypothetical protein
VKPVKDSRKQPLPICQEVYLRAAPNLNEVGVDLVTMLAAFGCARRAAIAFIVLIPSLLAHGG